MSTNTNATITQSYKKVTINEIDVVDLTTLRTTAADVKSGVQFVNKEGGVEWGTFTGTEKSVIPGIDSYTEIPDEGKYFSRVTVEAIPNQQLTHEFTIDEDSYNIPAGYYKDGIMVNVKSGSLETEVNCTPSDGYVNVEGTGVNLEPLASKPEKGYYIKAVGSGKISVAATARAAEGGYISENTQVSSDSFNKESNDSTKYYKINTEEITLYPQKTAKTYVPTNGKLISKVTVAVANINDMGIVKSIDDKIGEV